MTALLNQVLLGAVLFLGALLLLAALNRRSLRPLPAAAPAPAYRRLSVLIPARDEAANIGACLDSLLEQDHPNFSVWVLDDGSRDSTADLVAMRARRHRNLHLLSGRPLPPGWLGKHWACHQLAQAADGDLLLFTDADTCYAPGALRRVADTLEAEQADLLSLVPAQQMDSLGERLVVPLMLWSLLVFFPLSLAYRLRWPALAAAVGQCMLFRRTAYADLGGHRSVRGHAADDLALARLAKAHGLRWRLWDGRGALSCRMYRSFAEAAQGFSKNLFAVFDYRSLPFLAAWTWLGATFLLPWLALLGRLAGSPLPEPTVALAGAAALLGALLWALAAHHFRLPPAVVLLHPAIMAVGLGLAWRSWWLTRRGQAQWKGRRLGLPTRERAR